MFKRLIHCNDNCGFQSTVYEDLVIYNATALLNKMSCQISTRCLTIDNHCNQSLQHCSIVSQISGSQTTLCQFHWLPEYQLLV